jgi:hypothetical protein
VGLPAERTVRARRRQQVDRTGCCPPQTYSPPPDGYELEGLRFRVYGIGSNVWGIRSRASGSGIRV